MSSPGAHEVARASWGMIDAAEIKDFITLGRPATGCPLLRTGQGLTAFSILVREGLPSSGQCHVTGPGESDEIIWTGPGNVPFRPGVLDCALILLRAGVLQQRRHLPFIRDIISLLHDEGVAIILLPGELLSSILIKIQEELIETLSPRMAITTVRGITPESQHHCTARVLDAYHQIRGPSSSNGNTTGTQFVMVQIQRSSQPVTAENCRAYINNLVTRSFKYVQPPEPPYGRSPADIEFFRPLVPESCFLHLPNYYEWEEVYPELRVLLDNFDAIRDEALRIDGWTPWPEYHFREGGESDWRVFPFLHTFPALDASKSSWINATCKRCPETVNVLKGIPRLRTALLSKLGPNTKLSAHTGWEDLANHVLRVHLTIKTPPADRVCGLWVEGEVRHHAEKELIVFDDSKIHKAFNLHPKESRVVLILDLLRPDHVPAGVAVGGHTPELDNFIALFQ